jgi:rhodanese-related sulfurtransferase
VSAAACEWLARLKDVIRELTPWQVSEIQQTEDPLILDVREEPEWADGHIPGAVHLSRGFLELHIDSIAPDRARPIVLYCAGGIRSLFAGEVLQKLGYESVSSMAGGFHAWTSNSLPLAR